MGRSVDNYDWASLLLEDAGLPVTALSLGCVLRWMAAENPPAGWWRKYDPLNVADFSGPTFSFATLEMAAEGTAQVLRQANMNGIWRSLAAGVSLYLFSVSAAAAPWSAAHYHYPGFIASIPLPARYAATGPQGPPPAPLPPKPPQQPLEEHTMPSALTEDTAGNLHFTAMSTDEPAHALHFVLPTGGLATAWEVYDVTDALKASSPGAGPYMVAS
jgi:hypothetical protein